MYGKAMMPRRTTITRRAWWLFFWDIGCFYMSIIVVVWPLYTRDATATMIFRLD